MFAKTLLAATVIGAATAQLPAIAQHDFIERRQFGYDNLDPKCSSALSAVETLYSQVPLPPADLLTETLPADPCATPTFTGKLQSEWKSYTSEALQWYTSHSDELLAFVTACPDIIDGSIATGFPACSSSAGGAAPGSTTVPATTTTTNTTPAQTSGSDSGSGSSPAVTTTTADATSSSAAASGSESPSSTIPTANAAPRETGFVVAAAMAAAGLMGVAAL